MLLHLTVDSKNLEYGFGVIYVVVPSFFCFGIRRRSYSNFLASAVHPYANRRGEDQQSSCGSLAEACNRAMGCTVRASQLLPVLWPHILYEAIVSHTPNISQRGTDTRLGFEMG